MSTLTLKRLELALQRLLDGTPQKTKPDGKINLSRINSEAGLSVGAIYYYKGFINEAESRIRQHKLDLQKNNEKIEFESETLEIDKLKNKLATALRLKQKYKQEKIDQKLLNDFVVAQNISLAFRVLELESAILSRSRDKVVLLKQTTKT
jgi:hypothetical protein